MKAVIIMAGNGTRMQEHYEGPKQLLPVGGRPIVERTLGQLPDEVDELVFVVGGPHEDRIRDHFSAGEYNGRPITFVRQNEQLGVAHAFWRARDHVDGSWLGLVGDDVFSPGDIQKLMEHDNAALAYRVAEPQYFGVMVTDESGAITHAVEKPHEFISDYVWTGVMKMDRDFFETKTEPSVRGEYETQDVWMKMIQEKQKRITVVEADFWLPINNKEQLEEAEAVVSE